MKKILPIAIALIWAFCATAQTAAPHHYFRNINKENGLSQTDIKAIAQTDDGFMWFGTRNKLNRFDGSTIRVFDCFDRSKNIRNNNISALYAESDNSLWVGTDIGVFVHDPRAESFEYIDASAQDGVKMTDWVADIKSDQQGNKWIVIPNQGIFRYDTSGTLRHYEFGDPSKPDNGSVESLCIDKSDKIWAGTNGDGVMKYIAETDSFEQYLGDADGKNTLSGDQIYCMADYDTDLIIGCHTGKLRRLNKRRNAVTDFDTPQIHNKIIRDIKCFDNDIWVGTQFGVYVVDGETNAVRHISTDPMCGFSLSDNQIGKIFRDSENGVWIGTNIGGINYLSPFDSNFSPYVPMSGNSISSKRVRDIAEDSSGKVWLATEDAGVSIFNPATGLFHNLNATTAGNPLTDNKLLTIMKRGDEMWLGYFKNGLDVINSVTGSVRHFTPQDMGLNEGSVYAMCEDSNDNVWIGNGWSIYTSESGNMRPMRQMDIFGLNYNFDIMEDSERNIWVITMGSGVYRYNPKSGRITHFTHKEGDASTISSNSVSNVIETSRGQLWFSTDRGGISRFNPENDTFANFSIAEGLPDDTAYKMLEDKNGYLWFGTNNGLVRFNPQDGTSRAFTVASGLPSNQFTYKGALKASDGRFYFGCSEGLVSFNPYDIQSNQIVPKVYITKLLVDGKEVTPNDEDSPLSESITYTDKISLESGHNQIGFEFAVLSFVSPSDNKFAYKMDGVNDDWIYTSDNTSMTYANLAPGKYTFHVKGANADGVWGDSERVISIRILPPWWRTNVAMALYVLLFLGLLALAFILWRRRMRKEALEKERRYMDDKEKEVYRSKLDLYGKIAHEIRTPVTLISGPLESLLDMKIGDPEISHNLDTMRRSTNELMQITNQLLDFRKIDANKMSLVLGPVELTSIVRDKISEFESLRKRKGFELQCELPEEGVFVHGDRNGISKIVNNLLSNAFRYGDKLVKIGVEKRDNMVFLNILNDGEIISAEYQEKIFDPFYQMARSANTESSTGIGLNVARSLAELQQGALKYTIADGLNCFSLVLGAEAPVAEGVVLPVEEEPKVEEESASPKKQFTLLLVEDNAEVLNFVAEKLRAKYNLLTARNGVEALEALTLNSVDMVISDIMMPEMDGFELCRRIRSNIDTSHTPIILLTAKNDLDSRVEGLREGADAYIEKPFSLKHLDAQIISIFDKRERYKENFSRNPFITSTTSVGMSAADKALMEKIVACIEENLTEPGFNVESLADRVGVSRSTLHRKLTDLSGMSPADFVRFVRLKKAADLISEGSYRIGEICYLVGINSTSYFIKIFNKQFGMTPKEFEMRQRENRKKQQQGESE